MPTPRTIPFFAHAVIGAAAALAVATSAFATPVKTENVEAELVAERSAMVPGAPLTVALRLQIAKGWHTYWRNPGDSGLPTTLAWKLPQGISASDIEWPAPRALPVGPLVNYGYEGEVFHLVTLSTPTTLATGSPVTLAARADWLVCRETCIPEGADLTLTLPVDKTSAPDPKWSDAIAATRAALPKPLAAWQASARGNGPTIALALMPPRGSRDPGMLQFFASDDSRIEPSKPQALARDDEAYVLTLPVSSQLAGEFKRVKGVITAANGFADDSGALVRAATIDVALEGAVVAGPKPAIAAAPVLNLAPPPATANMSFALAILFALAGGVILNLMPCVFPVLSLKVMGFATHHDSRTTLHAEAVAFAVGVVVTFVVLGLALAGLRAAGEQLGWGFQLQSPAVVTALAMLFFVLALNLSGVFEFGQLVPSGVAGWTAQNRTLDAFGSGVLAVVIASPCTAPFMGAALGYALTGGTLTTLSVFVALGVGMATPYVLLALFPGWRRKLPRSGPWLARFKQVLAFPLYATVIWLAWVLGAQRDVDAVARLLIALLAAGFALWTWHIVRTGGARPWGIVGIAALVGAVVVAWPLVSLESPTSNAPATQTKGEADGWRAFSPALVSELTAQNRAVFVDFTAAWCVTCQVNKRLVLNTDEVKAAFARDNVVLVRADWTKRDDAITRTLASLGRNGVPVYVLYRPGKTPLLLPEVLEKRIVLDALATLG
jgi:thiol:disulfide interchange protein DsbD